MGKRNRRSSSKSGRLAGEKAAAALGAAAALAAASGVAPQSAGRDGTVSSRTRCVHVALIAHACVAIVAHVLVPPSLAFITPYLLVGSSCVLLAGCAGAPIPGWRSRVAAILVDDWRVPIVAVLVWVTLSLGFGMQLAAASLPAAVVGPDGTPAPTTVFGRHVWVGATAVQGLCAVVLEYNLSSLAGGLSGASADPVISVGDLGRGSTAPPPPPSGGRSTKASRRRARSRGTVTTSPTSAGSMGAGGAGAGSAALGGSKKGDGGGTSGDTEPAHEIYGPRRPILFVVTDVAAFIHGILWFFVVAATQTISLVFVQWLAVVALVGEALYRHALERLPVLRYHGVMWTGAVACLTLYGWESNWEFPPLPLVWVPTPPFPAASS